MKLWLTIAILSLALPAGAQDVRSQRIEEADGSLTLVHELSVDATVEDVWAAISTREGWTRWAVPVAWTDPEDPDILETSYDPRAQPGAAQNIRQRFITRIPQRLLVLRTLKAPEGFADFEQFSHMQSVFELSADGEGATRVRLTGVGYPQNEAGRRLLEFFERGNAMTLEQLKAALEVEGTERSR